MVANLLQLAATVLLAATFAADVIMLTYLTSRDGIRKVIANVPKYVIPHGPYEHAMYIAAAFIVLWELTGSIFGISRPSSVLGVFIVFLVVMSIFITLKQYDDAEEKNLDLQQKLLLIAFPLTATTVSTSEIVRRIRVCVLPEDEPVYVSTVCKSVLELKELVGINILAKPQHEGETTDVAV